MNDNVLTTDNLNVVRAWADGKNARNHRQSLKAVDGNLYSYDLQIGARTKTGVCVVGDYTAGGKSFHSQTTSSHVNLAKRFADEIFHPLVCESSALFREELPF